MAKRSDPKAAAGDVIALVTAIIAGDDDTMFDLVEQLDDPRLVIAGMCGLLGEVLPQWAEAGGFDLQHEWADAATNEALRLAQGEPA